jgi:hypothetical protein
LEEPAIPEILSSAIFVLDQFSFPLRDFLSFNLSVENVLHLADHVVDACACELDAVLFDLAAR